IYKVIRIHHKGVISPVTCGTLITTVTLSLFTGEPKKLKKKTTTPNQNQGTKGKWLKPVNGQKITSPFGQRKQPIAGASTYHEGIDIGTVMNAVVTAPAQGKVIFAGWENPNNHKQGYGQYIKIDHGNGLISLYGHLNKILVSVGRNLNANEQIGWAGNTGNSSGPHLHFGIYRNGVAINPIEYIGNY
ncbi:MAG: M23 family metallopeptidase, partial [Bacilli bacterium]|nr:M23 family metallopeptidase [Bacilli bacterium]